MNNICTHHNDAERRQTGNPCPVCQKLEIDKLQETQTKLLQDIKNLIKVLDQDIMWMFNREAPKTIRAEYASGGSLANGPNNCQEFFQLRKAALEFHKNLTF